ncbi:DUF4172 domain-containing protein [uncultured Agrobacterium sp.]|uniref:DUF4172 domain-containing protein n=1 Tax=uncultured Agrobacterium sp. TaxID=157277 RepID=UPI0025E3BEBB|nr:DUF4172 domain-containing protein [uncultured Agrobacterium sp.]
MRRLDFLFSASGAYILKSSQWPKFRWKLEHLASRLSAVRLDQGRLIGRVETLGFRTRKASTFAAGQAMIIRHLDRSCKRSASKTETRTEANCC